MGKTFDFDKLVWAPPRMFKTNPKPLVGWDTETHRGNVLMVCADAPDGSTLQLTNDLDVVPYRQIFDAMYKPKTTGVWWNLRYDIECILKQLPEDQITGILTGEPTIVEGYSVKYVPRKAFILRRMVPSRKHPGRVVPGWSASHFDLAQFFQSSLEEAARQYLNTGKLKDVDRALLGKSLSYWKENYDAILRYCIRDCRLTRQCGELWQSWADEFGMDFAKPFSPAFVAGIYAWERGWPNYGEYLHSTVGRAAFSSYYGGRFETRMKGSFEQLHLADIRSAYPSVMAELPSSNANWERCRTERRARTADWGFVYCEIGVNDRADWSPVMLRTGNLVYAPVGNYGKRWITLDEYRACLEDPNTNVSFIKSWIADDDGSRPLTWIRDIYEERVKRKKNGEAVELALKILMNSVYGKMLQRRPVKDSIYWRIANQEDLENETAELMIIDGTPYVKEVGEWLCGPLFNPIWGSYITARTRLKLWDMMQRYDTAMVMTDGLLTPERIPASEFGPNLGDWEDNGVKPGIILGNGMYEREGEKAKRRGFGNPSVKWSWLETLESASPNAEHIEVMFERPLHPGECIISNSYSVTDVGVFVDDLRRIKLNEDNKRVFPKLNVKKLLSDNYLSVPVTL